LKAATKAQRRAALLHDAAEYVIGDMISPFKAALGVDYKAFELRLMAAIHVRFGLPAKIDEALEVEIKQADKVAAYLEATQLAGFALAEAEKFFGRPRGLNGTGFQQFLALTPLPTVEAKDAYLQRFEALI